ncbi:unnamed protein product [Durusdinium trenchii]|uniref:Ion transport domain-containing protein n=1 Tax=Durusdinium trenchii TaxID=1381693 RepID=A0ABP0RSD4_9DINO
MANVFAVLAAHQRSLHELIDAQHQVLRQQLADAGWLRDIELDGGAQLEGISGGLAPKLGTSQQSLQPTLPDDVDPLPPNTPKSALLTASPSAFVLLTSQDSPSVNSAGSHLAQPELTSQEVVKILSKTDEEEQETSPGSQPLGSHSSAMIAQRAFSKNDKVKFIYRLDCLAGLCVLVNSIFMAIELEFEGRFSGQTLNQGHAPVADPSFFFSVSDNIFAVLYFLELMARIAVERRKFFTTLVNWFDIFLATITCFDVWVLRPMALSGGATDQMILLRLARAVKSMRAIRMVRTLRLFRGLRVLVQACYSFLPSLCWSMVLLGIFMVMGALMLGNMLQEFIADQGQDFDTREWIWQHYGTALRAMYTLYEITFAGNWPTYARPVIDGVSSYFAVFFLLYITLIVFAVIRVITAIFLKDTLDAASNDAEHLVVEKLQKKAQYVKKLEKIFCAIDEVGNGMITQQRMSEILQVPEVKAYFQTLEVDVHEGAALFHILDNGDGEVTREEFIDGILRCKGPARAIDQVAMQADLTHLHDKLSDILKILEEVHHTRTTSNSRPKLLRRGSMANHLRLFRMDAGEEVLHAQGSNRI